MGGGRDASLSFCYLFEGEYIYVYGKIGEFSSAERNEDEGRCFKTRGLGM